MEGGRNRGWCGTPCYSAFSSLTSSLLQLPFWFWFLLFVLPPFIVLIRLVLGFCKFSLVFLNRYGSQRSLLCHLTDVISNCHFVPLKKISLLLRIILSLQKKLQRNYRKFLHPPWFLSQHPQLITNLHWCGASVTIINMLIITHYVLRNSTNVSL